MDVVAAPRQGVALPSARRLATGALVVAEGDMDWRRVNKNGWLRPDWPAPGNVRAVSTTRRGGVSEAPYDSLNLGGHVGDDPEHVRENRRRLESALSLPSRPLWLSQVHGRRVVDASAAEMGTEADGAYALTAGVVCAVMTADCLPVLFCDRSGTRIAAVHAGWRGLCAGVLETAVEALATPAAELLAWLGPAIGAGRYEVGDEVRSCFLRVDRQAESAFRPGRPGHWLADVYELARQRLRSCGVRRIYGGGYCTYEQSSIFFSYRRDGVTGRMASLIWLSD